MKKIPIFENFIPVGFTNNTSSQYSIGTSSNISTGYNMDIIAGPVTELSSCIAKEAYTYENDDNPDHTLESYLAEVKNHISQNIDEACKNHKTTK